MDSQRIAWDLNSKQKIWFSFRQSIGQELAHLRTEREGSEMAEITYKDLPADAVAVYLEKRRVGTIIMLSSGRWQYCPDSRADKKGAIMESLGSVKRSLEGK